ncbi:hypothetical protein ccbrp13_04720 [Ktedonobacteria bacterium brp13]|nr:hypothetical protein ccbrp13_04720 [Ktedonobacteria bacterium brp13]
MEQEMQNQAQPSYGYEGEQRQSPPGYQMYGQKLSEPVRGRAPTPGQRLALAIVSLVMLIILIFGLTSFAVASSAPNWAVIPIIFIFILFSAVAIAINLLFNRSV